MIDWSKIEKALGKPQERPANSVTAKEYKERYGVTKDQAYDNLDKAVKDGKMKRVSIGSRHYYVLL